VALSANPDKIRDASTFGAHEFFCYREPILGTTTLDYIINTVAGDLPWDHFIGLLEPNGTLINLGVSKKGSMEIPYMPHLFKQRKLGSMKRYIHTYMNTHKRASA
jgi:D-arabinose 1-dehydrogenase-like Zn-dependent alcohol dehydrogenase